MWTFFWSLSPVSSIDRLRFWGVPSDKPDSCAISGYGSELPLTLCAGVGRVVARDDIDVVMLVEMSVVLGDN